VGERCGAHEVYGVGHFPPGLDLVGEGGGGVFGGPEDAVAGAADVAEDAGLVLGDELFVGAADGAVGAGAVVVFEQVGDELEWDVGAVWEVDGGVVDDAPFGAAVFAAGAEQVGHAGSLLGLVRRVTASGGLGRRGQFSRVQGRVVPVR